MKFKFETGEIVECFDEGIAKLLGEDKRYTEVKRTSNNSKASKASDETKGLRENAVENEDSTKSEIETGDEDAEVQE